MNGELVFDRKLVEPANTPLLTRARLVRTIGTEHFHIGHIGSTSLPLSFPLTRAHTSPLYFSWPVFARYVGSPHHDLFGHLTNCSINKRSPFASQEKDVIGGGCKWTLRRLRRWVEESSAHGVERWDRLWAKIRSLVCLTVLPLADVVPGGVGHDSCFELFGFDVMVDSRLSRPHLIEVNCSPALGLDEPADREVKLPLISDLLDLVDIESACLAQEATRATRISKARSMPSYSRPLLVSPTPTPSSAAASCLPPPRGAELQLLPPRASQRPPWLDRHHLQHQNQRQQQQRTAAPKTTTPRPLSLPVTCPPPPAPSPLKELQTPAEYTPSAVQNGGGSGGGGSDGSSQHVDTEPSGGGGGGDGCGSSSESPAGFGFEMVFPFSTESADHARRLSKYTGAGKDRETKGWGRRGWGGVEEGKRGHKQSGSIVIADTDQG
ncbi:unnamed protein product [Ectocarpus sp. CCAP 1310/34]|nr:unnamed protein product [Ectocarpus sp. CCAP 1310/34]